MVGGNPFQPLSHRPSGKPLPEPMGEPEFADARRHPASLVRLLPAAVWTGLGANSRLPVDVQEEAEEDREAGEATEGCGVDGRSQEGNRIPSSLWDLTTAQG